MGPHEYASYIGRVMYNRRSKMNPLYNQFIVAGKKASGDSHLAFIDHQGTAFEEEGEGLVRGRARASGG